MNNTTTQTPVVTRMAPSPTGTLHIGTARTALINFLYARHMNGTFVMRSEDTDTARSTEAFETEILDGLSWLGLDWDAFYRQSERTDIYRSYLERALESGAAYTSQEESKRDPGTTIEVVRLKNPNKSITFTDTIRGEITFDTTELGDFVIARSLDDPLYHLTVVVDDLEMGVTHVLRGEDHISNTPRQILIQEAIGAPRPVYAHLPLILAPNRSKMSKRHGAVAVSAYREEGFLPEAIVNYLALLGWNPGTEQEIFTMDELIAQFKIDQIQKGGAVFDRTKFEWINKAHLQKLDNDTYFDLIKNALPDHWNKLPQYSDERLTKLLPTIKERVHTMREFREAAEAGEYDFAFAAPEVPRDLLKWKKDDDVTDALPRLSHVKELLDGADFNSPESIQSALWDYAEEIGKGEVLWPLRVALTGKEQSPDPFTCAYILGAEETEKRIETACATISP